MSISDINTKADLENFFKYHGHNYTLKKEVINNKLVWNVYETIVGVRGPDTKIVRNDTLSAKANQLFPLVTSNWTYAPSNSDGYWGGRGRRRSRKTKKSGKYYKKSKKSKKSRR